MANQYMSGQKGCPRGHRLTVSRTHGRISVGETADLWGSIWIGGDERGRYNTVSRILIVDDKASMRRVLKEALTGPEIEVDTATNGEDALARMGKHHYDVVVTDLRMPKLDGIGLVRAGRQVDTDTEFIVVTAYGTIETAVEAMRLGAHDFVSKPFDLDELELKVRRLIEPEKGSEPAGPDEDNMIGTSRQLESVRDLIRKVSSSTSSVLITGETGTGKELVARAIHYSSPRRDRPFLAVNCSALPATLLESELFGHEKGAFTGADRQRKGRFEIADGGTLFLDEIADTELAIQAKLLRAVESGEFDRVGGTEPVKVDVRLLAATNQDIHEAARKGLVREDRYYRLNVFAIHLPPLRERLEDVGPIALHMLERAASDLGKKFDGLTDDVISTLTKYDWPGNVRELANCIERAAVISESKWIDVADLPQHILVEAATAQTSPETELNALAQQTEQFERKRILESLEQHRWNRTRAAEELGIKRTTLQYKIKKYGLL